MRKNSFRSGLKNFLSYSKSERNGTLVLAFILLAIIIGSFFIRPESLSSSISNNETYEKVESFFSSMKYIDLYTKTENKYDILAEELASPEEVKHFFFNPNTVSIDSLIDLGLSPKQAQVVINYRSKGGKFKVANDFSKIHVIDSATFLRLKPWIRIPEGVQLSDTIKISITSHNLHIELNSADTLSLIKLKGIGRSFARRIVSYRDLLGGFYSIDQLNEVYGLSPDVINSIRENIWIDSTTVKRLNLNLISYEDLKGHPYLTDYLAKSVIYYRSKQGVIAKPSDLLANKIIPADRYHKIAPYLTVK